MEYSISLLQLSRKELVTLLFQTDPIVDSILKNSTTLQDARSGLFNYLNNLERLFFDINSDEHLKDLHIIIRDNAKECIQVLKNIIRTENERLTHFSALEVLLQLAQDQSNLPPGLSKGFLCEFIAILRGINGKSSYDLKASLQRGRDKLNTAERTGRLDRYAEMMSNKMKHFSWGTDSFIEAMHRESKDRILQFFHGVEKNWEDHRWHIRNVIRDRETLESLVRLDKYEIEGLVLAEEKGVAFEITPYYLSLFNPNGRCKEDEGIRAQVIPSKKYVQTLLKNRQTAVSMDFMDEKSTSPIEGITRRYPQIVVLKPILTCPQLCVYCQRNWEIKPLKEIVLNQEKLNQAIDWIRNNPHVCEVIVTGGDPLILTNLQIGELLEKLSAIPHIERIRIGTRVLVTLPQRIDEELIQTLRKFHQIGKREICIVTHVEHSTEITNSTLTASKRLREAGLSIYNQQVFTYYNSRKFETCALRKALKLTGIDPYYTFNTKGKDETADFRVPIARIEQERKEEARFLPGLVRTDEPVFNVPRLGKSHLRSWQNHEVIMILRSGKRVYRFYPWESKVSFVDDYIYTDVSIYDYLSRLVNDGEEYEEYASIWYYF